MLPTELVDIRKPVTFLSSELVDVQNCKSFSCGAYFLSLGFQAQGFTAEDFDVMCGIASWATCGPAHSREKSIPEECNDRHGHEQR
jgi:hypothetical protein